MNPGQTITEGMVELRRRRPLAYATMCALVAASTLLFTAPFLILSGAVLGAACGVIGSLAVMGLMFAGFCAVIGARPRVGANQ